MFNISRQPAATYQYPFNLYSTAALQHPRLHNNLFSKAISTNCEKGVVCGKWARCSWLIMFKQLDFSIFTLDVVSFMFVCFFVFFFLVFNLILIYLVLLLLLLSFVSRRSFSGLMQWWRRELSDWIGPRIGLDLTGLDWTSWIAIASSSLSSTSSSTVYYRVGAVRSTRPIDPDDRNACTHPTHLRAHPTRSSTSASSSWKIPTRSCPITINVM